MSRSKLRLISLIVAAAAATMYGQSSPVNRQWPPDVQKVSDESPALTPDEALKTFYMPPGYRLELVASEPLVQDPIVMDWDLQGRIWVVEMPGFVPDLQVPEPFMEPIGKVVVLEDTNHDGKMDKRTVFADNLVLPRSLKVLDAGVLVAEPPNVWLMKDTNGDLKMDKKELITDQYGRREARVEQNANSFFWGLDNWMHTANGDVLLRFKDGKFEVRKTLSRGEWGVTQDDAGRIYRNTNESIVHADLVPTPYFMRNPNLLRTRGSYERLADEANQANVVWPVRKNPGTNRAYQLGIDREDGTLWHFTSVCAPMIYRGDRLPTDLYGNVFVAEPAANLVGRGIIDDSGSGLRVRKAYDRGEFLASTDERFRPVWISNAPDGTLYIVDMYRGVIQQRADITEYLRDHIINHKLEKPNALGRIYRVVHETTKRDTTTGASGRLTTTQLVDLLSHPNGWWRETAQRLLIERGDRSSVSALARLAVTAKDPRAKLHALWTLDGLDALQPDVVIKALEDPSRDVRMSAVRLSERWLTEGNTTVQAAVLKRLDDQDWSVRYQLAASVGALPPGGRERAVASVVSARGDDPIALDAALSGVRGAEGGVLENVLQATDQTPQRETAITMIAATIVRTGQDDGIQKILAAIADSNRPLWQRSSLLRGAEVALLGAAMPGTPARRGGPALPAPPCPTCPGARGGPGGSYAFPQVAAAPPVARRPTRLSKEPTSFAALAAATTDLGPRAAEVLKRVEWPGKPGAAAPIAPLTPEEQQRFNAGQEVYRNICQACHQPDGRGQDRVAPSLVGSPLALASPDIPARILMNGKEGPIGLMPPVGFTLSDEQIAGVLTYIRREWGQDGTPVDAATVKQVRAMTADRTRPWKHDELMALVSAGRGGK
jgi:mono/diheme cytochrome c family protein/glucose/arabinose dehydrogenase/HEAT repeat protein